MQPVVMSTFENVDLEQLNTDISVIDALDVEIMDFNGDALSITANSDDAYLGTAVSSNSLFINGSDDFDGSAMVAIAASVNTEGEVSITFQVTFTKVVSINKIVLEVINNYPNPVSDIMAGQFESGYKGFVDIEIISTNGRMVEQTGFMKTSDDFGKTLDVSDISSGVYILKVKLGKEIISGKFSKKNNKQFYPGKVKNPDSLQTYNFKNNENIKFNSSVSFDSTISKCTKVHQFYEFKQRVSGRYGKSCIRRRE